MSVMGALFSRGEQIRHQRFAYRGVIYRVDPVFLGSNVWYEKMAVSKPPKNAPWYHVLVHESDHTTYVAQRNLEAYSGEEPIDHPMLAHFFDGFVKGRYLVIDDNRV